MSNLEDDRASSPTERRRNNAVKPKKFWSTKFFGQPRFWPNLALITTLK
jgi:hypothetical protein